MFGGGRVASSSRHNECVSDENRRREAPPSSVVTVEDLIALVAQRDLPILPFVGAGLTRAAGAPSTEQLAIDLAARLGVPCDPDCPSLSKVTRLGEDERGPAAVQKHVAEIFSGLRLRPTPALTALCGVPGRRILTTNYDDAIERAARDRGLEPISLLPDDIRVVDDGPADNQLYVIHLHGRPEEPATIVLPGATTHGLNDDEVFRRFVTSVIAPRTLLFLGFGLNAGESHLHQIIRWLGAAPADAQQHYLLLESGQVASREKDLEEIASYRNVTVVSYEADPEHTAVERVALAIAPRAEEPLTWVHPPLLKVGPDDDEERLRTRASSFDFEWSDTDEIQGPADLLREPRSLVVGGPGLGKSTLLENLPGFEPERPYASGSLRDFRPSQPPERAIARLLRDVTLETLEEGNGVLTLDGLDETDEELEHQAVAAIRAATERWPDHTWVVSSRPGSAADALAAAGFVVFRLFASRRWAKVYLRTRAVPADRVKRALLDGYGLGDLLAIPAFASRLADRLLTDAQESTTTPLELLVEEQYRAAEAEARRHGYQAASLASWLRSVAVALELRGRTSVQTDELTGLPGAGDLEPEEARRRLIDVTLLADVPGATAFPARTLQEGLAADAILGARDVASTVTSAAVGEVVGTRLRDDMELTLDLVFEHADASSRSALRAIDPLRWARTVHTRGTEEQARTAFDVLWTWHLERRMSFALGGESGLRTSRQAVAEIVRRWPQLVEERRAGLEHELLSEHSSARLRALTVLASLPRDNRTSSWLLPLLSDDAPRVAELAAATAGRLGIDETTDALFALLESREDIVRVTALRALVNVLDVQSLPELARRVRSSGDLRHAAKQLNDRLDVDTAIRFVGARGSLDETCAWLIDRLVDSAHPAAWTPSRVAALFAAVGHASGGGMPDPDRLASLIALQPEAAISAIRLRRIEGRPWAPRQLLLPLTRVDQALLAGEEHTDLRAAVQRAVEEDAEIRSRQHPTPPDARLRELLDRHGVDVDPREIDMGVTAIRDLQPHHAQLLQELMEQWWPRDGYPEDLDAESHAALMIAVTTKAPVSKERWLEALDAHLQARFGRYPLGSDHGTWWLRETYVPEVEPELRARIEVASIPNLQDLAVIGRAGAPGAVTDAVIARLRDLGPETRGWAGIVRYLAERGAIGGVRELLTPEVPSEARQSVIATLAQQGDARAQVEYLNALRNRVEEGESVQRLSHIDLNDSPEVLEALKHLAEAAVAHGAGDIRGSAIAQLQEWPSIDAMALLETLTERYSDDYPWLGLSRDRAARRFATQIVLERIPTDLAAVAEWFAHVAASSDDSSPKRPPGSITQRGAASDGRSLRR